MKELPVQGSLIDLVLWFFRTSVKGQNQYVILKTTHQGSKQGGFLFLILYSPKLGNPLLKKGKISWIYTNKKNLKYS